MEQLTDDILLALLRPAPSTAEDLKILTEKTVTGDQPSHIILDMTRVETLSSSNLGNLLILRKALDSKNRRLIMINTALPTKCLLNTAGIEELFEFAENKDHALKMLQKA